MVIITKAGIRYFRKDFSEKNDSIVFRGLGLSKYCIGIARFYINDKYKGFGIIMGDYTGIFEKEIGNILKSYKNRQSP